VFSASPETVRRKPREVHLLRSVGQWQDLAVCSLCDSGVCVSPARFLGRGVAAMLHGYKVPFAPIRGEQIRDQLASNRKRRSMSV